MSKTKNAALSKEENRSSIDIESDEGLYIDEYEILHEHNSGMSCP